MAKTLPPKGEGRAHSSGDYLERRSAAMKRAMSLTSPPLVLVVEDTPFDSKKFAVVLKQFFGDAFPVRIATSIDGMIAEVKAARPAIVFLDDHIGPRPTIEGSLPALRSAGFKGPVVAVSGFLTQSRIATLSRLDLVAVLNKDDLDGTRIAELVLEHAT